MTQYSHKGENTKRKKQHNSSTAQQLSKSKSHHLLPVPCNGPPDGLSQWRTEYQKPILTDTGRKETPPSPTEVAQPMPLIITGPAKAVNHVMPRSDHRQLQSSPVLHPRSRDVCHQSPAQLFRGPGCHGTKWLRAVVREQAAGLHLATEQILFFSPYCPA